MREYIEQRIEELKQEIPTFESYSQAQICRVARRQELEAILEKFPDDVERLHQSFSITRENYTRLNSVADYIAEYGQNEVENILNCE